MSECPQESQQQFGVCCIKSDAREDLFFFFFFFKPLQEKCCLLFNIQHDLKPQVQPCSLWQRQEQKQNVCLVTHLYPQKQHIIILYHPRITEEWPC